MIPENRKKTYKGGIAVTYLIALICLLAGLFVPLYGGVPNATWTVNNAVFFIYLPALFNLAVGRDVFTGSWVTENGTLSFEKYGTGEPLAWALLAYALIAVLAIIFLIPVLAGKRTKKTSARFAYFIEISALLVLAFYFIVGMSKYGADSVIQHYNLVIAAGGTLLMLIIQALMTKKSLGLVKVVLAVLSGVAALCLYDVSTMGSRIFHIYDALNAFEEGFVATIGSCVGFARIGGETIFGKHGIGLLMNAEAMKDAFAGDAAVALFNVALIGVAAMALLNLMFDIIDMASGSKYNKRGVINANSGSKIFGLIRYIVTFVFAALAIVALLIAEDGTVGINLYLLTAIVLLQLIIAIVRACRIKRQKERARTEEELFAMEDEDYDEDEEELDDEEQPVAVEEEPVAAPKPQPVADEQVHTIVYKVRTMYNGPTDEFIETLSTDEKIEFAKVFLEKSKGEIPRGVPDYEVGGDNDDFFAAIFIHLGKTRVLVSKELLKKFYVYINKNRK